MMRNEFVFRLKIKTQSSFITLSCLLLGRSFVLISKTFILLKTEKIPTPTPAPEHSSPKIIKILNLYILLWQQKNETKQKAKTIYKNFVAFKNKKSE